jgi:undecaprenyl-diphosphatase
LDYTLFKDVNGLSGSSFSDSLFKFLANDGVYVAVAIVAVAFLFPWSQRRVERRTGAVTGTLAAGLALLVAKVLSGVIDRTRPFVAHPKHAHLLIHHGRDAGFPSDHATGTFALAMGVWLFDRTIGAVLLVLAAAISFARVYVGVHYPGDVVGGALIGIAAALLLGRGPLGRVVGRVAEWCSALWDSILARAGIRQRAYPSP